MGLAMNVMKGGFSAGQVGFSAGRLFSRKQATAFQPATYIDFYDTNIIRIVLLSLLFRIIFKTIYF
jgi:hypothetical protein